MGKGCASKGQNYYNEDIKKTFSSSEYYLFLGKLSWTGQDSFDQALLSFKRWYASLMGQVTQDNFKNLSL